MCSGAHDGVGLSKILMDVSLGISADMGDTVKFVRNGDMEILMTPEECAWGRELV